MSFEKINLQKQVLQLQSELEDKNKVNRYQKTEKIPDKNVIYIITCENITSQRKYRKINLI
jgi:hypothetical protein